MFDQITVILLAFTGKLKEAGPLRKYFWAFLASIAVSMLVLAYNAFMSLNYYSSLLERFTTFENNTLAIIVTIAIAVAAYFLISSVTGTFLDYLAGRKEKTEGHLPMFVAIVIALGLLLALDINANLKGVDYVAHSTTESIQENPVPVITSTHDARIKEATARWNADISATQAKLDRLKKPLGNASHKCNMEGCEKGVHKGITGLPHWQGRLTPYGLALVSKHESHIDEMRTEKTKEIAAIRAERTTQSAIAKSEYERDVNRYETTVADKQTGHTNLVWFAYGLAALLSIFANHFTDRALAYVYGEQEPEKPAAFQEKSSWQGGPAANPMAIGFKVRDEDTPNPRDFQAMARELQELRNRVGDGTVESTVGNGMHGNRAYRSESVPSTVPEERSQHVIVNADGTHTTGFEIVCGNCGDKAIMRSPRAKYCSPGCRKESYEKRTGKKLRV